MIMAGLSSDGHPSHAETENPIAAKYTGWNPQQSKHSADGLEDSRELRSSVHSRRMKKLSSNVTEGRP